MKIEKLKKALQTVSVMQERDRGRNVMIFNLPVRDHEEIDTVVAEVFEAIGEKPSKLTVPNPISVEIGTKRDAHMERGT